MPVIDFFKNAHAVKGGDHFGLKTITVRASSASRHLVILSSD